MFQANVLRCIKHNRITQKTAFEQDKYLPHKHMRMHDSLEQSRLRLLPPRLSTEAHWGKAPEIKGKL